MTTTTRSNFAAGFRTTVLLATLTGLFVAIGFAIGGPQTALLFLFFGAAMNLGAWWFSDRIALKMAKAVPMEESQAPQIYAMTRELCETAESADAGPVRDSAEPAQRLRNRAQSRQGRRRDHGRHHAAAQPRRAEGRDRPRARPHPQPRHADPVRRGDDRRRDHLPRLHAAVVRRGRQQQPARGDRFPGAGPARADRGDDHPACRSAASASTRPTPRAPSSAATRRASLRRCSGSRKARSRCPMDVNKATECLYIVKPLSGGGVSGLFSTHPPIEERVRRLRQMRTSLG